LIAWSSPGQADRFGDELGFQALTERHRLAFVERYVLAQSGVFGGSRNERGNGRRDHRRNGSAASIVPGRASSASAKYLYRQYRPLFHRGLRLFNNT
jgi:hypothetical protein